MSKVPKKFTQDFMDELKTLIPDFHMEIVDDESTGETKLYVAKNGDNEDPEDPVKGVYVHMSKVYAHYQDGVPIGVIARQLVESCITDDNVTNTAFKAISDWESAKSLIIGRLYNPQLNPEYFDDKIYRPVAGTDLVVPYYLQVETDTKLFRVCVSDGLMRDWGVTIDDLERARIDNTPTLNPLCVMSINSVLAQFGCPGVSRTDASANMMTITNQAKKYGAISVLDPSVHSELDKVFGAFGYYLIPSSVHEFLAVGGDSDPNDLRQMLKDINENILDPRDVLSYNIYIWQDGALKVV